MYLPLVFFLGLFLRFTLRVFSLLRFVFRCFALYTVRLLCFGLRGGLLLGGTFLRHLLFDGGRVHFMWGQQVLVRFRFLQKILHHLHHLLHAVHRHAIEPEAVRLLALPVEIGEESRQCVAVPVKPQEVLRVLLVGGGPFGCTVLVQAGHHADLARLLVPDEQNLFVFLFFSHN